MTAVVTAAKETKVTGELLSSASNQTLSQSWQPGQLPPVAGNTNEVAEILAQKVAAKTDESIPALLTSLQLSGFFITNKDSSVLLDLPEFRRAYQPKKSISQSN
jgi:hypothetical protein